MGNVWLPQTAPAVIATPDATYLALFISDGTSGTTAGTLYSKNNAGTVTALTYSDEQAQDAIGAIFADSSTLDVTYDDAGNAIGAEFRIQFAGLVTAASKTYVSGDRGKYYQRANGGTAMTDTLPTLTAADNGWTLKVANMGTVVAETITFTAPVGTFTGGATTYVLQFGCRQTFIWTGTAWIFDAGNGNITKISATTNTLNGFPKFADTTGRNLIDSGLTSASFDAAGAAAAAQAASAPTGRTITAGAGLTGGGDLSSDRTVNVGANADGSITVNADDIKVGVLATDAQHGIRAGATTHAVATPATTTTAGDGTAGFMTAVEKLRHNSMFTTGRFWVNIVDYGADPTGVADSTTAIQNAINALQPGGVCWVPAGTFKVTGTLTFTTYHIHLTGVSMTDSRLTTNHATADLIQINSWYCSVNNLSLDASVTRTAGFAINIGAGMNYAKLTDLEINNHWSCIWMRGTLPSIDRVALRTNGSGAANGAGVLLTESTDKVITKLEVDNASNPTGWAAVRVTQTASLRLMNCNLIHSNICLDLAPTTGLTVPSIEIENTFFDTSNYGMVVQGAGSTYRCKLTNCWFGSHVTAGVWFNTTNFDGITFANCDFYGNATGIKADTVGGGHWAVHASRFAGNTVAAIAMSASAAHFPMIIGNEIGPTSAFGANAAGITVAAGTYKGLIIANNAVINNTTNATLGAVTVAAGEASWYQIKDNAGINPLTGAAVTTPAVAASTVATTNTTGRRVVVFIKVGATAITACSVNGVVVTTFINLAAAATTQVALEPGGTIAFTYTVVPTWIWIGN